MSQQQLSILYPSFSMKMTFSSDATDGSDLLKAYVVNEQTSKTMSFGDDFQPEDVKTIYPYSRYQNTTGGMIFPSIIAKPGLHDTPRPLHVVNGLGEGTMGRVFLTLDSSTDKLYAMKVFNKEYVSACGEVESTVRERSLLAETRDNLFTINLQASFQDETRLFMLLDFCVGGDLATELTRYKGKIPMENIMYNAAHLVEGIASLHKLGIIHRDLKPENILLTARGDIKISDFGSAVRVPSHDAWIEPMSQFGTPAYLSPEVFSGHHNCSLDWWSLGIILYEMTVGKHPFLLEATHGDNVDMEELTEAICYGEYTLPETLDQSTRRIIRGLLRINPHRRYGAQEARDSAFFDGWDWETVRRLGYIAPRRPNTNTNDATFNFDPEFRDMDIDEKIDIDLEGVDPVDDPSRFCGFECTPDYAAELEISPEHVSATPYVQYQRRGLSIPHVPPPRRAFSSPNLTSMTTKEGPSPHSQLTDLKMTYSQSPEIGRPDPAGGNDNRFRNVWKAMRICLAAITQFK